MTFLNYLNYEKNVKIVESNHAICLSKLCLISIFKKCHEKINKPLKNWISWISQKKFKNILLERPGFESETSSLAYHCALNPYATEQVFNTAIQGCCRNENEVDVYSSKLEKPEPRVACRDPETAVINFWSPGGVRGRPQRVPSAGSGGCCFCRRRSRCSCSCCCISKWAIEIY